MAVTYISAASDSATTLTMPSHQTNDLLMFAAFNGNGSTVPTVPSGWVNRISFTGLNRNLVLAWRIASSGSVASGTWTNATQVACAVYRSNASLYLLPGHCNYDGNGGQVVINYRELDANMRLSKTPDSWVIGVSGTEIDTTANTAPTGMTNRTSNVSTSEIAWHDTNGALAWTSAVTVACTSTRYAAFTCEIYESPISTAGGGSGGVPLIGTGGLVY